MEAADITWFIIITIALTIPIILIKKYATTENNFYLILAILCYVVLVYGYARILKKYSIYHLTPVWLLATVFALLAGILFFSEKIKPINIIGIILAIVAIFLITR